MKRVIVSVTNDLATDQRVAKVCNSLKQMGFEVILIGRKLSNSLSIKRMYKTCRMNLFFNKGFFFYAEYNTRLFFKLLFTRGDILLANDLDTLLPNYLVSRILKKKLVYDSHELFTEIPELINKSKVKWFWGKIERNIFPKLKNVYTVNQSIADIYSKKYGVEVNVIRNIAPSYKHEGIDIEFSKKINGNNKMLILQGTGINIDRGAEEAVKMMQFLNNTILYIIGGGDVFENLKDLVKVLKLKEKVVILDKIPYDDLMKYTRIADFGLSLDKGTNLNYEYALPNKVFDYIHAETPLIVSNRKEVASLVKEENIGLVIDTYEPRKMAIEINGILNDSDKIKIFKVNVKKASKKYNWENESKKLEYIFSNLQ